MAKKNNPCISPPIIIYDSQDKSHIILWAGLDLRIHPPSHLYLWVGMLFFNNCPWLILIVVLDAKLVRLNDSVHDVVWIGVATLINS